METCSLQGVSKGRLLRVFSALVGKDRGNTAELLEYIGEIDRRKLYLEHAYPSMFEFCTKRFRMSEAVAFKRIRAGRSACRFPCILGMVRRGELHLTRVHQLAGHLTAENYEEVLRRARHRSMREIEGLIAELSPKGDVVSMIRALPKRAEGAGHKTERQADVRRGATHLHADPRDDAARPTRDLNAGPREGAARPTRRLNAGSREGASMGARKPKNLATPLSPRRYKLQVTIGQGARDKLAELQNLLSHQIPDGDLAAVIERALDVLLAEAKKAKAAVVRKPRASRKQPEVTDKPEDKPRAKRKRAAAKESPETRPDKKVGKTRAIPAQVRRAAFERDEGRCAFVDASGRRCGSGWQVEFHHCIPYGRGGLHSAENVELRCRAHNQYEAEREYGRLFMSSAVATSRLVVD